MSDLYDTHEQGERVKTWLRENGSAIIMGLVLAFALMFGFKQWQAWQTSKRQQASAEYQVMLSFIEANNMDDAVPNYEVLKSEYPNSPYTSMASMMMAKARLQSGQVDLAASELMHAMDFVVESTPGHRLLDHFIEQRRHMVAVIGEYGEFQGVVTLEDVLECLLGEQIVDEHDRVVDLQEMARRQARPSPRSAAPGAPRSSAG